MQTKTKGWGSKIGQPLKRILRWLVWATLLLIFIRGAAMIVMPQDAVNTAGIPVVIAEPDGLRVFPLLFTYEYLDWQPENLSDYAQRIKPYLASALDSQAGWIATGESRGQAVLNAWVYGLRSLSDSHWLVTVAARVQVNQAAAATAKKTTTQIESATEQASGPQVRTMFLAIPVAYSGGGWVVSDYPTLLPVPEAGSLNENTSRGQSVSDDGERVQKLLTGFFKVYTTEGQGDATYYLLPGCPTPGKLNQFTFSSLEDLKLYKDAAGTTAWTKVILQDGLSGSGLILRYTFRLVEQDGRWYIKEIMEQGV